MTGEEEAAIKKVLAYKKLAKKYQPALSDPVKGTYKSEVTSTDLKNYFKVWLQMGLKHPDEYFQAFFALWIKRKYFDMAAFLPVFLIVCVCLLSPRNDNLRYIYPACVLIPGMLANLQGDR